MRKCNRKNHFYLRLILSFSICLIASILLGLGYMVFTKAARDIFGDTENRYYAYALGNIVSHFCIYGLSIVAFFICYKEKAPTILFGSIAGYASHNLLLSIKACIDNVFPNLVFISLDHVSFLSGSVYLIYHIIAIVLIYYIFARKVDNLEEMASYYKKHSYTLLIIVAIILTMVKGSSILMAEASTISKMVIQICNICCCFVILFALIMLSNQIIDKKESETIRKISELQLNQYRLTKENADLLNEKCHDFKHQLLALKNNNSLDNEYVEESLKAISIYDSNIKTGNEILDVIITDKSIQCNSNNIEFYVLFDGRNLSFMSDSDICSIFGNMLDNAINYLNKQEGKEKRIRLTSERKANMMSICIKNTYYGEDIKLTSNVLRTTNKDASIHGFGMKSIKRITESYGGSFALEASQGWFTLSLIIPFK